MLRRSRGWGHGEGEGPQADRPEPQGPYDYHIHDTYEAGIVLSGTEVKSLREARQPDRCLRHRDDGEVWLRAAHIPEYSHGTWTNHNARRTRKLLLNRREIAKIQRELATAGTTLVPLSLYFSDGTRRSRSRWLQARVRQAPDHCGPGVEARGRAGDGCSQSRTMKQWCNLARPLPSALGRSRPIRSGRSRVPPHVAHRAGLGADRPTAAYAADDQIDSFTIDYNVQPSGGQGERNDHLPVR